MKLETYAENTWCPGCSNFGILTALKEAIFSLIAEGIPKENIVIVSEIGCGSKIIDYLNLNSFSSLHGRPIISAEGIKLGNPNLKLIVCAGDGGIYNEGIAHLIHAAKRNSDITVLVHNNRTFALTTGQFTATSPRGFKGKSTPEGSVEQPINPLKLVLASNGTFIARGYALKPSHLKDLIIKAVKHPGFSFVDILQPCISFFDTTSFYNQRVYEMKEKDLDSQKEALKKIEEWDYSENNDSKKIPIGIFYKVQKPTYEKQLLRTE
ncbi:2-oxoglutarate synthase [Candidatus Shapirobacteria bacterium CG10_big_fil_rev_8_21_14_0_10_38_14]|uniref:2-oxoglutarate synthase n=1 Tax=Candidatus Shapirobacteria bacterium CG10_big_fil_rev_8_21_14_0_10_38_14 TaxID=1974483 RepID=A0A2M8L5J9_9BACT|nr:MAG: 2-oxoglutarate synthase [Candidatus Shapirobacteria bacterium CG10_big_fil_rev_8_21_14_0_10_38_14]